MSQKFTFCQFGLRGKKNPYKTLVWQKMLKTNSEKLISAGESPACKPSTPHCQQCFLGYLNPRFAWMAVPRQLAPKRLIPGIHKGQPLAWMDPLGSGCLIFTIWCHLGFKHPKNSVGRAPKNCERNFWGLLLDSQVAEIAEKFWYKEMFCMNSKLYSTQEYWMVYSNSLYNSDRNDCCKQFPLIDPKTCFLLSWVWGISSSNSEGSFLYISIGTRKSYFWSEILYFNIGFYLILVYTGPNLHTVRINLPEGVS